MCHVSRLSVVNRDRLRRMPREYREQLERALENEGYVASTRSAVTPIFERVYAAWQEREATRIATQAIERRDADLRRALAPITPESIGAGR